MESFIRFIRDEEAVTAVEYALMLSLIIVVSMGAVRSFGDASDGIFAGINNAVVNMSP
jgi:Flp pilus assembly pilin Flp